MTQSLHGDPGTFRRFDSIQTLALISDTHGLLRESAIAALEKVDLIVHAGDVGPRSLLRRLETLAPVVAVRGNVDSELAYLAPTELICVNEQLIFVLHDLSSLELDPAVAGLAMVGVTSSARLEYASALASSLALSGPVAAPDIARGMVWPRIAMVCTSVGIS